MRRFIVAALAAGSLLVGPFAAPVYADHDPVREAFCRAAEKLGVVWVQDCNLH